MASLRIAVLLCVFGFMAGCSSDEEATVDKPVFRPNIVLFMVDDLRHDALGATGHPFFQSPNIDRLADEGVVFGQSFVVNSLCSPSRATMLTGLYAHEHGVRSIWSKLSTARTTFAGRLQDVGYDTAWIGKWHLNIAGQPHNDFDHWVSYPVHGAYLDPTFNVDGKTEQQTGHLIDLLTARALDYLDRPHERPFFMALSHSAVHEPYVPQARFAGMHAGQEIELPATWDDGNPGKPNYLGCRAVDETDEQLRVLIRDYFDMLAGVEESFGLVFAKLEELEILDNTLILFVSDNGYLLGEHGMLDKRAAYEPSIRIPMLARYPRWFTPGQRVDDALALNLDLPVTILDAAGASVPAEMHGFSLRALADGEASRDGFVYHYYRDPVVEWTPSIRAYRTADTKYITHPGSFEPDELYDLRDDPDETLNLASDPQHAATLADMKRRLAAELDKIGAAEMPWAGPREDPSWIARIFLNAYDSETGAPIPNATFVTSGDPPLYSGVAHTGSDGRWFTCAKTSEPSLWFRLDIVSAPGYVEANPYDVYVLAPGNNQWTRAVKLRPE